MQFMAKGYLNRNYLQREGDFPEYTLSVLPNCAAHHPSVCNQINISCLPNIAVSLGH